MFKTLTGPEIVLNLACTGTAVFLSFAFGSFSTSVRCVALIEQHRRHPFSSFDRIPFVTWSVLFLVVGVNINLRFPKTASGAVRHFMNK